MESKHTPGPWKIESRRYISARGATGPVAEVMNLAEGGQEANARLIAATTELLEALKDIIAHCHASPPCGSVFRGDLVPRCHRCRIACDAIAKAEAP